MSASSAWPDTTIGREFDVMLGKMLDAERNRGDVKPFIGNRAVQWGRIDVSAVGSVPLTANDQRRFRLRPGDLLVCEGGEVGRAAIWQGQLLECYYQKALHRLRSKSGYRPDVLLALLELWAGRGAFADFVTQTSIAHLPRERFIAMPLPLIPREEQRAIADALSDVSRMVAALERLVAKREAIKQGLMQELLTGRTRLPGFEEEWETTTLGEVARVKTGSRNNQDKSPLGKYPFFVRSPTVERIDSFAFDCEAILVPGEGNIGSIFHYVNGKFDVHQRVYKISHFDLSVHGRFVFHYLHQFFGRHALANSVKATVDSLRLPTFTRFEMRIPGSVDEQRAIAQVLTDADDELVALRARLEKAKAVKQGMMQELLTGRTRLPAPKPAEATDADDAEVQAA